MLIITVFFSSFECISLCFILNQVIRNMINWILSPLIFAQIFPVIGCLANQLVFNRYQALMSFGISLNAYTYE